MTWPLGAQGRPLLAILAGGARESTARRAA